MTIHNQMPGGNGLAMPAARAATASRLSQSPLASCLHRIAIAWRKYWKRQRQTYVRDLRMIQWEHRHLYRHKFYTGLCGDALCGLLWAYDAKHLRSQRRAA